MSLAIAGVLPLYQRKEALIWCCLPDFDSPSVFAKILDDEKGGSFSIDVDDSYTINQKYLYRTNVLCTQFRSGQDSFEVIDFMPRYKTIDNDYFAPSEIYRYIRLLSGKPTFKVHYNPLLNYAMDEVAHAIQESYIRTYSKVNPNDCIYLYSSLTLNDILDEKKIELKDTQFLLLSYNQKLIDIDINRVYLEYQRTKVYWLNLSNRTKKYQKYTEEIIRSVLVLKLMTFQSSGAILAALTTSIPESIGEVRNWDYRFCWLRDASMSVDTLIKMGHYKSAHGFLGYIKRILQSKHDSFQIMYGIRGERALSEADLPHFSGYGKSKPVRIGNAAYSQRQNDVFGYLLNVIYQYYVFFPLVHLMKLKKCGKQFVILPVPFLLNGENLIKESGKYETGEKHFVFSKVMSWVAMDRATKIADFLNKKYYAEVWQGIANNIKEDVLNNGWKEDLQTFTQTYCNSDLDASLLLMAEYGFIDAGDVKYKKNRDCG